MSDRARNVAEPSVAPRRPLSGWPLVAILFVIAGALLYVGVKRQPAPSEPAVLTRAIGSPAPNVHLLRLDGKKTELAAYLGRPLWLNFFATWCGPCKKEMPAIQRLYAQYRDDGLLVLGIDQEEDIPTVTAFARDFGLTFPLLIDQGEGTLAYHVAAIPKSVFIDSRGIVVAAYRGQMSPQAMREALGRLLGESVLLRH